MADEWISVPCLSHRVNLHAIIAYVYCFTSVNLPPATGGVLWIACGARAPIYIYKLFNQCSQLGNKLPLAVLLINEYPFTYSSCSLTLAELKEHYVSVK